MGKQLVNYHLRLRVKQVEHLFKNFTDINKQKRFLNPLTKSDIKTVTSFIAQSLELNRENTRKNQSFFNRIGDESVLVE
jgi:NADH/NAD ratio-sensing transcriptional regulator Rex